MARVLVQIGYTKNKKQTQTVKAYVDDLELHWNDNSGKYLTSHKDRKFRNMLWYMYELDLSIESVLRLSVKTYLNGAGIDEERTFEALYQGCDEDDPIKSVDISGVGLRNYPLIKGRIQELSIVSEDDKRKSEIEDFLNEGF